MHDESKLCTTIPRLMTENIYTGPQILASNYTEML